MKSRCWPIGIFVTFAKEKKNLILYSLINLVCLVRPCFKSKNRECRINIGKSAFSFLFCCCTRGRTQGLIHATQVLYDWILFLAWGKNILEITVVWKTRFKILFLDFVFYHVKIHWLVMICFNFSRQDLM